MALARISMTQVQKVWKQAAQKRGYFFGFNLKTLRSDEASLNDWFFQANVHSVISRTGLKVAAYLTAAYLYMTKEINNSQRRILGTQEIHWAGPGSHTGATHAEPTLKDFPAVEATLINHSEVIEEQGRTLEQSAAQLRMALDTTVNGRTFKFITLCVGEDRATYDKGQAASVRYVKKQVRTMLILAGVTAEEMSRIGIAYEPRFAIQVGDIPGVPPSDAHIKHLGWAILHAVAQVVGLKEMAKMFCLQYGGSMKGPENEAAPVQRFVGPESLEPGLYNGGLIGTAGKDPVTAAAILHQTVPVA